MNITQLSIGVREGNSDYINEKIRATNFLCVLFGLLGLPFFWFTYSLIPGLAYLPALFFVTALVGIGLNYLGLTSVARFVVALVFLLVFAVYASSITPDHEPLIASFLAMQVLYLLPAWILFDLEEKNSLIFYSSFSVLVTLFLPALNDLFTYPVAPEVLELFKNGWLFYACLITAVLGVSGALLFLEVSTYQTGKKNALLIKEMYDKAEQITANERKLNDSIVEIEKSRKDGEKRQWVANGLAKFADLLRVDHGDSQKMFDSIVSNLVRYVGANQAGLFLINGEKDNRELNLVATYAYDRKKFLTKTIAVGEGVLGQAVLEKASVFMTVLPDDYLVITSGLGEACPRCLLVSPLMINKEVYGVIEMGSFTSFEPHVREFIEKVGESIASTLSSMRINEKTKTLLEELQQQTEEMKSQEEEMRQNMEELIATQEEMQRKEQEYLQRIADLEQVRIIQSYN